MPSVTQRNRSEPLPAKTVGHFAPPPDTSLWKSPSRASFPLSLPDPDRNLTLYPDPRTNSILNKPTLTYSKWLLPTLQQVVILNQVLIVKFSVTVVVAYVATSLVNKDEYKTNRDI